MFGILFLVTVAGMPSLKELPVKEFSPADVLIAETSLATETYPAATGLLPSNKLFCTSPITKHLKSSVACLKGVCADVMGHF